MSRRRLRRPPSAPSSRPWRVLWSDGERGSWQVDARRVYWGTAKLLELERPGCRLEARHRIAWRVAALTLWGGIPLREVALQLGVSERQARDDLQLLRRVVPWMRDIAEEVRDAHVSQRADLPVCAPGIGRLLRDPPPVPPIGGPDRTELARSRSFGLPFGPLSADTRR